MILNIIFALVIIFLMAGAFVWMWKLSKWLVIPIQIILFVLLAIVVVKVFVNKDNAERLHKELEKSGVVEVEKKAVAGAVNSFRNNDARSEEKKESAAPQPVAEKPVQKETPKNNPAKPQEINFIDML